MIDLAAVWYTREARLFDEKYGEDLVEYMRQCEEQNAEPDPLVCNPYRVALESLSYNRTRSIYGKDILTGEINE
jgi:hypothetical protein